MLLVKIKKRLCYYYIYIYSSFLRIMNNNKRFPNSKKNRGYELAYHYLYHKYNRYLNKLPIYEHSHEYSNKVWWCWLQGENNSPDLNKACLNSLRKNLKGRNIIVITEDNMEKYVKFPSYIIEKYKKGYITRTHFSDLLRIELLINYGGTWIDSSVLCTSWNEDFFDTDLFVFKHIMRGDETMASSSWFITSEKNNPILRTTRDLLYKYHKDFNHTIHYFTFHFFFKMATEKYKKDFDNIDSFSNVPPHILQFELLNNYSEKRFKQYENISSIHKLNQKIDFSKCDGNTNYDYIIKKYKP